MSVAPKVLAALPVTGCEDRVSIRIPFCLFSIV